MNFDEEPRTPKFELVKKLDKRGSSSPALREASENYVSILDSWNEELNNMSDEKKTKLILSSPEFDKDDNDYQDESVNDLNYYSKINPTLTKSTSNLRIKKSQSFIEKLFYVPKKKTQDELRDELLKYKSKLVEYSDESKSIIKKLQISQIQLKNSIDLEFQKLKKYGLFDIIPTFRLLSIIKIIRIIWREELEQSCEDVIQQRVKLVNTALSKIVLPCYIDENFFKDIEELLASNSELPDKWNSIKKLDKISNKISDHYVQLRNLRKKKSKKEIGNLIKEIKFDYEIDEILLDSRISEGESIETFLDELKNYGYDKMPASEINGYIKSYIVFLTKRYLIKNEVEIKRLELMIRKNIFSLISSKFLMCEINSHSNKIFIRQSLKLSKLKPIDMRIHSNFISNFEPFQSAIEELSNLNYLRDPDSMISCITQTSSLIFESAMKSCKEKKIQKAVSADDFLPMMQYVLIQSDIVYIDSIISFIRKFKKMNNEDDYYLTTLQSAVEGIKGFSENDD